MEYISIRNLEKHQHYKNRDIHNWIKLKCDILNNRKIFYLCEIDRWRYIGLLLLAVKHQNMLLKDVNWLKSALLTTHKHHPRNLQKTLDTLLKLNLIVIHKEKYRESIDQVYSGSIAKREKERERERCNFNSDTKPYQLSKLLGKLILKRKPDFTTILKEKDKDWQTWAIHIDLMMRLDGARDKDNKPLGISPSRIEEVIKWCQEDDFWQNNILSTIKLRKQFDKLELQFKKSAPKGAWDNEILNK